MAKDLADFWAGTFNRFQVDRPILEAGEQKPVKSLSGPVASVEPASEFRRIRLPILGMDAMMGPQQKAFQVRGQRVHPLQMFTCAVG